MTVHFLSVGHHELFPSWCQNFKFQTPTINGKKNTVSISIPLPSYVEMTKLLLPSNHRTTSLFTVIFLPLRIPISSHVTHTYKKLAWRMCMMMTVLAGSRSWLFFDDFCGFANTYYDPREMHYSQRWMNTAIIQIGRESGTGKCKQHNKCATATKGQNVN